MVLPAARTDVAASSDRATAPRIAMRLRVMGSPGSGGSAEAVAEVDAADLGVVDDLVRAALEQHLAGVDDRGAVDDVEGLADVVVGDQDTDAAALQVGDHLAD